MTHSSNSVWNKYFWGNRTFMWHNFECNWCSPTRNSSNQSPRGAVQVSSHSAMAHTSIKRWNMCFWIGKTSIWHNIQPRKCSTTRNMSDQSPRRALQVSSPSSMAHTSIESLNKYFCVNKTLNLHNFLSKKCYATCNMSKRIPRRTLQGSSP